MDDALIDQLRAALAPNATPETKQHAAELCKMLMTALLATPGEPLVAPGGPVGPVGGVATPAAAPPSDPVDVLLSGVIAKYGHLVPQDPQALPVFNIPFVPLPPR